MISSEVSQLKLFGVGEKLRAVLAQAGSEAQLDASGGKATMLHSCLTAFNAAIAALRDVVAPVLLSQTSVSGSNVLVLTYTEAGGLDPTVVPAASAFVFAPVKVISDIVIVGNQVRITTVEEILNAETVAYTQPAVNGIRDQGGLLAASFTAQPITVA